MTEYDTLVTRWSHHTFETPLPLVARHTIGFGDVIDSSHYGKVKVIEIQKTREALPTHSVQFFFARPDGQGGWRTDPKFTWTERYPGDSRVPLYERNSG